MCGIVGAVCNRDVFGILIEGLKRLEYRGYDSAGLSLIDANLCLNTQKTIGRVADLEDLFNGEIPTIYVGYDSRHGEVSDVCIKSIQHSIERYNNKITRNTFIFTKERPMGGKNSRRYIECHWSDRRNKLY